MTDRNLAYGAWESMRYMTGYAPTKRKPHTLAWLGSYALTVLVLALVIALAARARG